MCDTNGIRQTHEDDQWEAQGRDWERQSIVVANAVAAHYQTLRTGGVPRKAAAKLTRDFQADLMAAKVDHVFEGMMLFREDDD